MTGRHRRHGHGDSRAAAPRRPARGRSRSDAGGERDGEVRTDLERVEGAKGEQTRRAILLAAIDRFGQDGFRATSIAKIARDAGVGATITWNYFPNKEALFLAAL